MYAALGAEAVCHPVPLYTTCLEVPGPGLGGMYLLPEKERNPNLQLEQSSSVRRPEVLNSRQHNDWVV